jgi:hypothetical protein
VEGRLEEADRHNEFHQTLKEEASKLWHQEKWHSIKKLIY